MMTFVKYLFTFFLFLIFQLLSAQYSLSPEAQKEDFDLFKKALAEVHPGLYRYTSKEEFDRLFADTATKMQETQSRESFYRTLVPLVDAIHCGHTKFHPEGIMGHRFYFNTGDVFPLQLHFTDNKAFVVGSYTADQVIPLGAEVRSINKVPMEQVIERLMPFFVSDGRNKTFKYLEMDHFFSAAYANMIGGSKQFDVEYSLNGTEHTIQLNSMNGEFIQQQQREILEREELQSPYTFQIKGSVGVMKISSFWREDKKLPYKKFLKQSFEQVKKSNVKDLIIDLRNNEGGIDKRGALLLSYLMDEPFPYYDRLEVTANKKADLGKHAKYPKFYGLMRMFISKGEDGQYLWKHKKLLKVQKPKADHFDGNVYVLINGASFSVTSEFAAMTHHLKRATFIGEETGGAYYGNNSGTFVLVTLPNSKLTLGIPMMAYHMKVSGYPYSDRGIVPDYPVQSNLNDLLNGTDPIMGKALEIIDQNKTISSKS